MAQFHPLTVTDVRKTIRDAVIVTLQPADGADFTFVPGQYLTFRKSFDGVELRRSYSICAGLDDGVLQVGIKRVDGGAFSTWVNEEMQPGDVLEAMPPMGRFHTPIDPDATRHYLGFAGGSGVTPILSILKTVLAREPKSRFTLVYANRGVHSIMFRDELDDLKNLHMGRLNVIHVLETDAQEIDLFTGLVTQDKVAQLFEHWIAPDSIDTAFICGPEPMMKGIQAALRAAGIPDDRIKFELFASAQTGRAKKRAASRRVDASDRTELRVTLEGTTRTVSMARDVTLLDAALENDLEAPHACRAGVCSTCVCKVIEGEVEMQTNHALEDHEVADGLVLSCQSYPVSARVVIDYDR
ncbi:2Fe-2S iron-sulfur cluster binding domain-containing protein [Thalassococcus sp. CAU 1522]|uniref:2Fe-2S iron-sulfur cluster binding domain-containing protein n=1 Tax=Thalassococcus arenae TaxID=2851652 RepID=A0ABS6N419_9RHOB|nr:2Fe-2S iron-sulfur cluster-binding protein [Thalassococcus arenae]MBV2358528.1 2Fe-2S iron-sulfur cluster binding domain-containing protein [Thalassococcus arenae]